MKLTRGVIPMGGGGGGGGLGGGEGGGGGLGGGGDGASAQFTLMKGPGCAVANYN